MLLARWPQTVLQEACSPQDSHFSEAPVSYYSRQTLRNNADFSVVYKNLGDQWATFVLAMITLVMGPFP